MTTQQIAEFNGNQIPVIEYKNDAWFTSFDIGKGLAYADPKEGINKVFERNKQLLGKYSTTVKLTAVDGKKRETRIFNEEGVMIVTMKSGQPKADEFIEWAVKILKAYRHGTLPISNPDTQMLIDKDKYIGLLETKTRYLDSLTRPKWRKIDMDEQAEIWGLRQIGWTVPRIARYLSRSTSGIHGVLKRMKAERGLGYASH